ncbi:hypothetical protein VNO78_15939 [Psophocarpus tetragonolobus]|uniref:Uncharacterized protein n=1 Tax=Psophocarpus tetragonolobus TaxID=3891 RepID=A0AAN9XK17_PSOTE
MLSIKIENGQMLLLTYVCVFSLYSASLESSHSLYFQFQRSVTTHKNCMILYAEPDHKDNIDLFMAQIFHYTQL